jgi:hypothetical protein
MTLTTSLLISLFIVVCEADTYTGSIHNTYNEALHATNKYKQAYGFGRSTQIIVKNELASSLTFSDSDNFVGRWQALPPRTVSTFIRYILGAG